MERVGAGGPGDHRTVPELGQEVVGRVLLAALSPADLAEALATPSRSPVPAFHERPLDELMAEFAEIRSRGRAATSSEMTAGVRSIAAPIRGAAGEVVAAITMAVIATEVTHEQLMEEPLPLLLSAAGNIGREFDLLRRTPQAMVSPRR